MTHSEEPSVDSCPPAIIINEVRLILAEKRTSLSSLPHDTQYMAAKQMKIEAFKLVRRSPLTGHVSCE
jgi:hypothetical protein